MLLEITKKYCRVKTFQNKKVRCTNSTRGASLITGKAPNDPLFPPEIDQSIFFSRINSLFNKIQDLNADIYECVPV